MLTPYILSVFLSLALTAPTRAPARRHTCPGPLGLRGRRERVTSLSRIQQPLPFVPLPSLMSKQGPAPSPSFPVSTPLNVETSRRAPRDFWLIPMPKRVRWDPDTPATYTTTQKIVFFLNAAVCTISPFFQWPHIVP